MRIQENPALLERLAVSYAQGTLRGGARRRFETLARENPQVRAAALTWRAHWANLSELQPPLKPRKEVWIRIQNLVAADIAQQQARALREASAPSASPAWARFWRSLTLWRGAALAGAFATAAAVAVGIQFTRQAQHSADAQVAELQQQLRAAPAMPYVAVLTDDQAGASMLVTFDLSAQQWVVQRVGPFSEGVDKSLQLWGLSPAGVPRSLGVLGPEKVLRLAADARAAQDAPVLAVSLEPRGGVPSAGGPTGPVLFKGQLIQREI